MNEDEGAEERRGVVFIVDFIDVAIPLDTMRRRFSYDGKWLADSACAAEEDGEALRLQIGPSWAGGRVTREVNVTLGATRDRGDARVVPIEWGATGLSSMFPVLSGDLELAPLDPHHCRLTLAASYRPPLGNLGRALDRALMNRVTQSTVRSFLTRVATCLTASDERATMTTSTEPTNNESSRSPSQSTRNDHSTGDTT